MEQGGRPTELTDELVLEIRKCVIEDKSFIDIQRELGIPDGTWDTWVYKDYKGFRTNLNNWRKERMIKKATNKVEDLIHAEDDKVALNASTFILETLGKIDYSKKTETDITSGGKPIPILGNALHPNNGTQENSQPQK